MKTLKQAAKAQILEIHSLQSHECGLLSFGEVENGQLFVVVAAKFLCRNLSFMYQLLLKEVLRGDKIVYVVGRERQDGQ